MNKVLNIFLATALGCGVSVSTLSAMMEGDEQEPKTTTSAKLAVSEIDPKWQESAGLLATLPVETLVGILDYCDLYDLCKISSICKYLNSYASNMSEQKKGEYFKTIPQSAMHEILKSISKLGHVYKEGLGVEINYSKAAQFYKMYQSGLPKMWNCTEPQDGHIQFLSSGFNMNEDTFYAKYSCPLVTFSLAHMYEKGQGVDKDLEKALVLYEHLARIRHVKATYRAGKMYEAGLGCITNPEKALHYYNLAADRGHDRAKEKVLILNNQFSLEN